jgi:predicted nucleic acid-binding protein
MAAVLDASVLITRAKIRRITLLKALYGQALIGPTVKREVVDEGKRLAAPGVQQVEQALQDGWLRIATIGRSERGVQARLAKTTSLHRGEIEVISIAKKHGIILVVDDKEARSVANALGISYLGTAGVLLQAYRQNHLSLGEFEDAIGDLTRVLWLSPTVVATIFKMAREEQ